MRRIIESNEAKKDLEYAPKEIIDAYEVWSQLIIDHGVQGLRQMKGYYDEKLKYDWHGYRSSRLNRKWRVIYHIVKDEIFEIVHIERLTPHDYRR